MAEHAAALLTGPIPEPRAALARAAAAARRHGSEVQLVRPDVVVGPRHVASAALHAQRAVDRGTARAQSLGLELLCFLTGRRQITQALALAGLPPGADAAVGVALGGAPRAALEACAAALGLGLAWEVPTGGAQALARLGLPHGAGDPEQRALELVALLDTER